jgi:tRNA pseudouridine55 synthase
MSSGPGGEATAGTAARCRRDIDGIVLLDKPVGISSNQALQRVRHLYQARKAGHTGSLDPLASGMLPICLGQATKVSAFLLDADKTYRVEARFGARTSTGDAEGAVIERGTHTVSESELERAVAGLRGVIAQTPPMYSALKHQGRRLYAIARAGEEVPRQSRTVTIHEFAIEHFDPQSPVLRVRCSKGTYVRTLVEDLARSAGTVGYVAGLRRLALGAFAGPMLTLAELTAAAGAGLRALDGLLLQADSALSGWPAVRLEAAQACRIRQGQHVAGESGPPGLVRLYEGNHVFVGVGERLADCRIVPRRLMVEGSGEVDSDCHSAGS